MPRTRIIIGYDAPGSAAKASVIYCGTSGAEAESVMKSDTTSARFEIFEGQGRRKNNPNFATPAPQSSEADHPVSRRSRKPS